jgi:hypothetical protein
MSAKSLKIPLTELTTLRLICKNPGCNAILETTLENLHRLFKDFECPLCNTKFGYAKKGGPDPLKGLAHAVLELLNIQDKAAFEFVVPSKD